ncbi:MAG: phosphate-starvation-inducible PsiE family protein [Gallionella sp.]
MFDENSEMKRGGDMLEQTHIGDSGPDVPKTELKSRALLVYGRILDVIVTALIFVMLLTLMGAVVGLILDFFAAANALRSGVSNNLAIGTIDSIDRELVIDVLSVFVLIELFRTFTDYLEFHRVRLRVLAEVGIAFVLREIFIGLYGHSMQWTEILALAVLLAILVSARIAAVHFQPRNDQPE